MEIHINLKKKKKSCFVLVKYNVLKCQNSTVYSKI